MPTAMCGAVWRIFLNAWLISSSVCAMISARLLGFSAIHFTISSAVKTCVLPSPVAMTEGMRVSPHSTRCQKC